MAWIELHQALWTHRKTYALADLLGIDETYAAAHLLRLWCWALDNAPDGVVGNVSSRAMGAAAGWSGDPDAFRAALTGSGWLDGEGDELRIHDWLDYAGRLIQKRQANAERMRQARGGSAPSSNGAVHVQRTSSARAGATVPNPTVPNSTQPNRTGPNPITSTVSVPEREGAAPAGVTRALNTPQVEKLIDEYGARLGGADGVRAAVNRALNSKRIQKWADPLACVRDWLDGDVRKLLEGGNGSQQRGQLGQPGERADNHHRASQAIDPDLAALSKYRDPRGRSTAGRAAPPRAGG